MQTFMLLTRLIGEEVNPAFEIEEKEKRVVEKVRRYVPEVRWVANYAVMGPWDYLDIFEAEDMATAMKVSSLVRYYGAAHTEIWPVMEWNAFEEDIRNLAYVMESENEVATQTTSG